MDLYIAMDIYRIGTLYGHIMVTQGFVVSDQAEACGLTYGVFHGALNLANELGTHFLLGILETVSDLLIANRSYSSHSCQCHASLAERHLKFVRDKKPRQLPNGSCTYLNGPVRG
jgi:hypothetical protein